MQKFKSHKTVEAAAIERVDYIESDSTYRLTLDDGSKHDVAPRDMSRFQLTDKDNGYLVRYPDGYVSWSPTKAFKEGYLPEEKTVDDDSPFGYLKPTEAQLVAMERLREAAAVYGTALVEILPEGPDKTFTIRNHRTTAMWANVALTRQPDGSPRK